MKVPDDINEPITRADVARTCAAIVTDTSTNPNVRVVAMIVGYEMDLNFEDNIEEYT